MQYAHNTATFIGKGGIEIFFQSWRVNSPRGILVIAHGVGEHSGRYENIIKELQGSRISIYAMDHRGHGKSAGKRGHIESFSDYTDDLTLFIDIIQEENENIPVILLGHSMGGVIACKYALAHSEDLSGLILSSPGFAAKIEIPDWKKMIIRALSNYIPQISLKSNLDPKTLSHDNDAVEAYENDRLVHDQVSVKWCTEFIKGEEECLNRALELRLPLLVFHGKDDMIVDYRASEEIFNNASSLTKELHLYDGLYHETMNEKNNRDVLRTVARWIVKIASAKKTAKHAKIKAPKRPIKKVTGKLKAGISKKKATKKSQPKAHLKKGSNK